MCITIVGVSPLAHDARIQAEPKEDEESKIKEGGKEGRKEGRKENVSLSKMNIDRKIFMIIYLLTFIVRPKLFLNTHLNGMV